MGKILSGKLPDENETTLFEMEARYCQKADSCSVGSINELIIKSQDAGGGVYCVIETERWAVEKPEELIEILKDFIKRYERQS